MPHTPPAFVRILAYKWVLKNVSKHGLCVDLARWYRLHVKESPPGVFNYQDAPESFPELNLFRPSEISDVRLHWFSNKKEREFCMEFCIQMLNN